MAVQSVVLFAQGEKDQAVQVLAKALDLAEPGGYIRLFVDEGALMAQLLLEAASRGIRPDYIARVLAAFEGEPKEERQAASVPAPSLLIEPLSPRELEVLKLLRTELNGPEIAQHLIVSLHTLRTHTNNIYNKLGVNSRRAAVRRAEELDLL